MKIRNKMRIVKLIACTKLKNMFMQISILHFSDIYAPRQQLGADGTKRNNNNGAWTLSCMSFDNVLLNLLPRNDERCCCCCY